MRYLAIVLALATTLVNLGIAPQASAAGWRVYHNAKLGYSVSYPGDWQHFAASGTDLAVRTADTGAAFDAGAEGGMAAPTAADLRKLVLDILGSAGVPASAKVSYSRVLIHGMQLTRGVAKVNRDSGQAVTFTGLVAYRAHVMYVFGSALVTTVGGTPRGPAAAQGRALARIFASITIAGPAAH